MTWQGVDAARWPQTIQEARALQEELSAKVRLSPLERKVVTIAGVDAAFTSDRTVAAVAVFELETLEMIEEVHATVKTTFPYVPGYLTFREGPAILDAISRLRHSPDLFMFDGQGIAHPRRMGIASHLGVILGKPTIGCAKSRLIGEYEEPPEAKGSWSPLFLNGEIVGAALRTRERVRPVFVSPGHLVTLADAIGIVMRCAVTYRLPEPLRQADSLARKAKLQVDLQEKL